MAATSLSVSRLPVIVHRRGFVCECRNSLTHGQMSSKTITRFRLGIVSIILLAKQVRDGGFDQILCFLRLSVPCASAVLWLSIPFRPSSSTTGLGGSNNPWGGLYPAPLIRVHRNRATGVHFGSNQSSPPICHLSSSDLTGSLSTPYITPLNVGTPCAKCNIS
jgi:hypothetical protein